MALRKRNDTWYWYHRENGKFRELSLGKCTSEEAHRLAVSLDAADQARKKAARLAAIFGSLQCLTPPIIPMQPTMDYRPEALPLHQPKPVANGAPMTELFDMAERHRKLGRNHRATWERFIAGVGKPFAGDVTPTDCQTYMEEAYKGSSAKTYNNNLGMLKLVWRLAVVDAGLASSPMEPLLPRVLDDVEHFRAFTLDEMRLILAHLPPCRYWATVTMISAYTGLRLESCCALSPDHIKDGIITIMPGKTARFGRSIQCAVLPPLAQYLATLECKSPDMPYVHYMHRETWWENHKKNYFAGYLESLGINDTEEGKASFHSIRATFVTRMSELGVPDKVVRGIVGHADQRTTDLYNHDSTSMKTALKDLGEVY